MKISKQIPNRIARSVLTVSFPSRLYSRRELEEKKKNTKIKKQEEKEGKTLGLKVIWRDF